MLFSKDDIKQNHSLSRFSKIKSTIFMIVYQLLKEDESSQLIMYFSSLIQTFQLLYFAFSGKLRNLWGNDNIADGIFNFLKYFSIAINLVGNDFNFAIATLYLCFALIIISIFLMTIISFQEINSVSGKNSFGYLLSFLRILLKFFLTIGFMPMIGLFCFILTCESDGKGNQIMTYIPTQQCWVSEYTVHAIIAIISIILLQVIVSIMAFLYFEERNVPSNYFAQRNGRSYAVYHFYITASTMTYILLDVPRFNAAILLILFCGSSILFFRIHKQRPFFQIQTQKIWSLITALNLWTVVFLNISYFLEGSFFTGTIIAWIIGAPIVILIVVFQMEPEVDLLAANINQASSGDQLIKLCEYMLRLIDLSTNDLRSNLLLDGYIEIHKQTCPKSDCVLKVKKQTFEKYRNAKDRNQILIEIINQIYYYGIKTFPEDVYLRLNYVFFLIDRMKRKQQALAELQQAEQLGPGLDHEFIIYRYKNILEEELQQDQLDKGSQLDIVTEQAFQVQVKNLTSTLLNSALTYLEFWSQLQEELPDIGRVSKIGFQLLKMQKKIEAQWKRLKRINGKVVKLNRLMGRYYQSVLNQYELGDKLLQIVYPDQMGQLNIDNSKEIAEEPLPTIIIQTEINKIGLIQNVNKAACSLIGYSKTDLINKKINIMQPDMFSKFHDEFIMEYLAKCEMQSEATHIGSVIFVKCKSDYIIPCFFKIRMLQSSNQVYLCSQIRQEVHHRPTCYLICNLNGIIENITSTCIKLLGIRLRQIKTKSISITDLFPDLYERQDEYKIKGGSPLAYTNYNKSTNMHSIVDFDNQFQCDQVLFQCSIYDIIFRNLQNAAIKSKIFGFIVKLERIAAYDKSLLHFQKKNTNPYQFKFNLTKKQYLLEVNPQIELIQDLKVEQSVILEDISKTSQINELKLSISQKQNYSEGIKLMRYWNGKVTEIDDFKFEEEEEIEDLYNQQNLSNQLNELAQEEKENKYSNQIKSSLEFEQIIQQSKIPSVIKKYKIILDIIVLILISQAYAQYFILQNQIKDLNQALLYLSKFNNQLSSFILIQGIVQNIEFINYEFVPYYWESALQNYLSIQQNNLNTQILRATELQNTLTTASINLNDEYSIYNIAFESEIVPMKRIDNSSSYYTFNEVLQQLISTALKLNSSDVSLYTEQNYDLFYFQYNTFNSLINYFGFTQLYFYYNAISKAENIRKFLVGFLICGCFVQLIQILLLGLYFIYIKALNESILILFLDLNSKSVKQLYFRCEAFITNLQMGEDEEIQSEQDDDLKGEDDVDPTLIARKKRRKYQDNRSNYRNNCFVLTFMLLLFEAYFLSLYFATDNFIESVYKICPILNLTSFVEGYYRLTDNALRQYFLSPNYTIGEQNAQIFLNNMLENLYQLDAELHVLHTENLDYLSPSYLEAFNQIYILSPCPVLQSQISSFNNCYTWNDGILSQGLSIALTQYFENLRYSYYNYEYYVNGENTFSNTLNYNISDDPRLNFAMNEINTQSGTYLRRMSNSLILICHSYLIEQLEASINQGFDFIMVLQTAFFVNFNAFLLVVYLLIWLPMHRKMCKGILKTRKMLCMIPINLINNMRNVQNQIKKFIIN